MVPAFVAHQITGNPLDPSVGERSHQWLQRLVNVPVMPAVGNHGIAAAIDDQIAPQHARFVRFGGGVQRGFDSVIRTQAVQR